MSEAFQPTQKKCDVCGEPLEGDSEANIRVLEVPYHSIQDMKLIDEQIASELLQNDGRLAFHSYCSHPIADYLPKMSVEAFSDSSLVDGDASSNIVTCTVCDVPVLKSVGECGRCGNTIEDG